MAMNLRLKSETISTGLAKSCHLTGRDIPAATMLLNFGADLDAVGDILGHRGFTVTMRYAKVQPRTKRNTMALLPSIASGDDDEAE
jgi:site-specific recombinase XerD